MRLASVPPPPPARLHRECILGVIAANPKCPLCRAALSAAELRVGVTAGEAAAAAAPADGGAEGEGEASGAAQQPEPVVVSESKLQALLKEVSDQCVCAPRWVVGHACCCGWVGAGCRVWMLMLQPLGLHRLACVVGTHVHTPPPAHPHPPLHGCGCMKWEAGLAAHRRAQACMCGRGPCPTLARHPNPHAPCFAPAAPYCGHTST